MIHCKKLSCPPKSGLDFIKYKQCAIFRTPFPQFSKKIPFRQYNTGLGLNRFNQYTGSITVISSGGCRN
jgi:hypothetical protein